MAQYLQSRVRLAERSRYDDERHWMTMIFKHLPNCPDKVLQIL
jgi:hypothetical protein